MRALGILWSLLWALLGLALFVGWLAVIVSWVRGGAKFPRWVHLLALVLTALGVLAGLVAFLSVGLTLDVALMCVFLPAAVTYLGWLWMGGPIIREERDR